MNGCWYECMRGWLCLQVLARSSNEIAVHIYVGWYKPAQTRYGNKQEGAYFHPRLGLVMPWPGCENQERAAVELEESEEKESSDRREDKKGRKRSAGVGGKG